MIFRSLIILSFHAENIFNLDGWVASIIIGCMLIEFFYSQAHTQ